MMREDYISLLSERDPNMSYAAEELESFSYEENIETINNEEVDRGE